MWRNLDSNADGITFSLKEPYVLLLLAFVTLGVYYPAILSDFCVMDDLRGVIGVLNLSAPDSAAGYSQILGLDQGGLYRRPLNNLVFYSLYLFSGDQALLFHLLNVLLHMGCGLVVYRLMKGKLEAGGRTSWLALVTALLFLLHPLNVEAVAWISGRGALMASFFALLAFYYHQRVQTPTADWRVWFAGGLYLLSLLTYELAAAMPLAFVGWDLLRQPRQSWREAVKISYKRWLPYGLVLLAYLVFWGVNFCLSQTSPPGAVRKPVDLDFTFPTADFVSPVVGVGFYMKKMVFPWPLDFHIAQVVKVPYFLLGLGLLLLLFFGLRRRQEWVPWGWASLCGLLPILTLTVHSPSWTALAERYCYLASGFFVLSVGLLYVKLLNSRAGMLRRALEVLPFVVLMIFGFSTASRILVWQDDELLLADTYEKSPDDGWVAYSYALVLGNSGRVEEAERHLKRAYDLGYIAESALFLGRLEESKGNYEAAERYYLKAAWPSSDVRTLTRNFSPDVYNSLAHLHWTWIKSDPARAAHHQERAFHFFKRAYDFSNQDPMILYNMGKFCLEQRNLSLARECFRQVYERAPNTYYGKAAGKLLTAEVH
ncbi:MAG TPA: tetratricopeptide repeat protein [Syntrophobacteria bacterium]|nr:tetratricopeptide repeat protein [Syntrophobacteria bacterium]